MSATVPVRMTADEFLAWAMEQPEGKHYELAAGEVVAMAPERIGHGRMKTRLQTRLADAIRTAKLPCEAFPDRTALRVDAHTIYGPDTMVRCGRPLDDNTIEVTDPVIVVEVVSPSSRKVDTGTKLEDYFRIPSVRHYLIVKTGSRAVIHHRRDDAGGITTAIVRAGDLILDPPGLTVTGLFDQV
jgi:Uma2 family endonuclease